MAGNKTCGCCDTSKSFNQFYKSPFEGDKGYLHICKTCCKKKLNEYSKIIGSDTSAAWLVLAELGVPFIQEVWKQVENLIVVGKNKPDLILQYLNYLSEMGIIVHGFWESDVMLDDICDKCYTESENNNINLKEEIKIWGKFLDKDGNVDIEAYEILNKKFNEYTKEIELNKPALINRYKDLCKAELRKIRLEENPESTQKDINAVTNEILTLMKLLKIDNFQSDTRTEVEKTLEYQIAMMEKNKPCEDEDINKYRDFCKFNELEKSLMRPLRNLIVGSKDYPNLSRE